MYRRPTPGQLSFENFYLPFGGKLSGENQWVKLAEWIEWEALETEYAQQFSQKMGAPAKSFRIALGALIIKERLGTSDEETVQQIRENPYLQYFLGLSEYQDEAPFEASMLVHFVDGLDRYLPDSCNPRSENSLMWFERLLFSGSNKKEITIISNRSMSLTIADDNQQISAFESWRPKTGQGR